MTMCNRSVWMSQETTASANCLLKRKLNKGTSSCLPSANTCLFTSAHVPWQQGGEVRMQRSETQGWELLFSSPACFAFSPLCRIQCDNESCDPGDVSVSPPSRSSLCFRSLEFRIGSEMLIYIIFPPRSQSLNSNHSLCLLKARLLFLLVRFFLNIHAKVFWFMYVGQKDTPYFFFPSSGPFEKCVAS